MADEEEVDLHYEVGELSKPFVEEVTTAWLHVEHTSDEVECTMGDVLLDLALREVNLVLADYGKPDAVIKVERSRPPDMNDWATGFGIETDDITADLINDFMNDHLCPRFREMVDGAGLSAMVPMTFMDGMVRRF